jgi:hypothetical protein
MTVLLYSFHLAQIELMMMGVTVVLSLTESRVSFLSTKHINSKETHL